MNEGKNLTSIEETSKPEPVLLAVDDDPDTLGRIEHELRQRYGSYYHVACEGSPEAGMRTLQDLRAADEEVAVVLADQWMPGMTGVEFLTHTRPLYPGAKRALLFERGNRTTREPILQAMALGQIDYYVPKPERPPDEEFHRSIAQFLDEWARDYRPASVAVRLVGEPWSARSHELRDVLSRSGIPHEFSSADSKEGRELLARVDKTLARLPVVIVFDRLVLADPDNAEIVDAFELISPFGLNTLSDVRLRPRDHRGGTRRPSCSGLWLLRGASHGGRRKRDLRRAGGHQFSDTQLPRFLTGSQRLGAGLASLPTSVAVRRFLPPRPPHNRFAPRIGAVGRKPLRRHRGGGSSGDHRHRSILPPAGRPQPGSFAGSGRILRGCGCPGTRHEGPGSLRGGRRELSRTGGTAPLQTRQARYAAGARRVSRRRYVPVPDRGDRGY